MNTYGRLEFSVKTETDHRHHTQFSIICKNRGKKYRYMDAFMWCNEAKNICNSLIARNEKYPISLRSGVWTKQN